MNDLYFERKFSLWFYQISHGEVIIRSPKNEEEGLYNNIDIYMGDIRYLEFPCGQLDGLRIQEAAEEDINYLSTKLEKGILEEHKLLVFISGNQKYYIVASYIKIIENTLNEDELPIYIWGCEILERDSSMQKIDKKEINQYDRKFEFWFYQAFDQEAMIRAPIVGLNIHYKHTIDIEAFHVKYLAIPIYAYALKIGETTEEDINYINKKMIENTSKDEILVLLSGNMRYYIVAEDVEFIKSKMKHYQQDIKTPFRNIHSKADDMLHFGSAMGEEVWKRRQEKGRELESSELSEIYFDIEMDKFLAADDQKMKDIDIRLIASFIRESRNEEIEFYRIGIERLINKIKSVPMSSWELAKTLQAAGCTGDRMCREIMEQYRNHEDAYVREVVQDYFARLRNREENDIG